MKLSLHATMIGAAIFAVICLGVAITGFTSLGDLTDPGAISDAKGFAWFWTFLGAIAVAFGLLAWWLSRQQDKGD
jgi:hypothetical protein